MSGLLDPVLRVTSLEVERGDKRVVQGVSVQVARSEIVSIVGPSGSGKTSFLLAVAGILPFAGEVRTSGRIGVVFQDHGVFPWLTVQGNVSFGLASLSPERRERALALALKICGIESLRLRYPSQLSGGQRQRVAVARTLAMEAELLLLDEPFASLDVPTRTGLRQWLRRLADERGVSIVMVTHDLDDAIRMSDRVLVLVDGCIKLQSRAGGASIASDPDLEQLRSLLAAAMI